MKVKVNMADPLLMFFAYWLSLTYSPWLVAVIPVIAAGWFFNPRWDSQVGWRFFHE